MNKEIFRRAIFSTLFLLVFSSVFAQLDTTFWFAVPDVSSAFNYDRPIFFRLSAQQQPCTVTISQPANGGMPTQTISIPANTTQTLDVTNWIANLECAPGNLVQNKGIYIRSNNKISVYYEVNVNGPNPEIFALKGKNSLGSEFYISSQYLLNNTSIHVPTPYSSFNIVATEDNTTVTINPTKNIVGHVANVPFNITLNKGQTYAAIATSTLAAQHLQGSYVTSTKPIAITLADDLLQGTAFGGACEDLAGDQTVPVQITGTEYIAFKSNLNVPFDKVYITATQNNTAVNQNGVLAATLNSGQSTELSITGTTTYIQLSAPGYAYQLAGITCEVGSAILPKINCTGSSSVSVVRSTLENFILTLLVKNGGQGTFLVNNSSTVITAGMFAVVPFTGGQWYAAKVTLPISTFPNGTVVRVSNTSQIFQMGVLEGGPASGAGFGYFSDFNSLRASAFTTTPSPCLGSGINLFSDSIVSANYSWTGPNGFTSGQQNPVISNTVLASSGNYILTMNVPGCGIYIDTISVVVRPKAFGTVNQSICQGQTYLGHNASGTYIDTLQAVNGCDSIRTLNLTVKPRSFANISQVICQGQTFLGHNTSGVYTDTLVAANGCDSVINLALTVKPKSFSNLTQSICQGQSYLGHNTNGVFVDTLVASNGCDSIRTLSLTIRPRAVVSIVQSICQGSSFYGYSVSGVYVDTFVATNGCDSIRTLTLNVVPRLFSSIIESICQGQTYFGYSTSGVYVDTLLSVSGCDSVRTVTLTVKPRSFSNVSISLCQGQTFQGHNTSGIFVDTLMATNGCDSIRTVNLTFKPRTFSTISQSICQGQTYLGHSSSGTFSDTLVSANGCDSIRTLNLVVSPGYFINIAQTICEGETYLGHNVGGIYRDTLSSAGGCDSVRQLNLTVVTRPFVNLGVDTAFCIYDTFNLNPGKYLTYLWQDGSTADHYLVTRAGRYFVTVTNNCGAATDDVVVFEKSCNVYFPDAFTPDRNGRNEKFRILNALNVEEYFLVIYNRWGQKVFETHDYLQGWDGTSNGKQSDIGSYVWYCGFKKAGISNKLKGLVVLIR